MASKEYMHHHEHTDFGLEGQQGFDAIKKNLLRIQKPFLQTLASHGNGHGYQSGVFTGATLCVFTSYALHEGLIARVDPSFSLATNVTNIFMNKIVEGSLCPKEAFGYHAFVELKHPKHGTLYVDPTYGQLDKRWTGKFLFTTPETIGQYYKTTSLKWFTRGTLPSADKVPLMSSDLRDISSEKNEQLAYLEKDMGITKTGFDKLVSCVKERF